jgi:excisionase family DNA binding protein
MTQHLTSKQVAERFQVDVETVQEWARYKKIPAIRISRSKRGDWRFPLDQIERWERLNMTFELKDK